jgi:hypothetical protein
MKLKIFIQQYYSPNQVPLLNNLNILRYKINLRFNLFEIALSYKFLYKYLIYYFLQSIIVAFLQVIESFF